MLQGIRIAKACKMQNLATTKSNSSQFRKLKKKSCAISPEMLAFCPNCVGNISIFEMKMIYYPFEIIPLDHLTRV